MLGLPILKIMLWLHKTNSWFLVNILRYIGVKTHGVCNLISCGSKIKNKKAVSYLYFCLLISISCVYLSMSIYRENKFGKYSWSGNLLLVKGTWEFFFSTILATSLRLWDHSTIKRKKTKNYKSIVKYINNSLEK